MITFANKFFKYDLESLSKDPDYTPWLEFNDCKFKDRNGKFGCFHFFRDGVNLKYQVMREVDDFIYIPVSEHIYNGETVKELIAQTTKQGKGTL